eukprot:TRINITY_DN24259_c0_g1_i2.p1 TRINITY_DN24259_c0_g1~~TRINITY_DN24259_c0_g1_i2.p1  ORF type:complete len:275 (-),score=23.94 TRINITY_DN24259_c0_g1_i2:108-842(-)
MSEGNNKQEGETGSGRRFFIFGPTPATQICGQGLRFGAFWVAVVQVVSGILFCLYGIFYLLSRLLKTDFLLIIASIALEVIQLSAGVSGLRCTVQKVVQQGLNERLLERLIVWSWLSGLMTLLCIIVIVYGIGKRDALTIVISILFTPLYAGCAYVVWSYKEEAMKKLPEYVGSWTRRNIRSNEALQELNTDVANNDGGGSPQQSVWKANNSQTGNNDNDLLLDEGTKPSWQPLSHGAYGQTLV